MDTQMDLSPVETDPNVVRQWMTDNGFTNSSMADKMGFSYEYIYKISTGASLASDAFKWRFAEVFGHDLAQAIFSNGHNEEEVPEAVAA